ncbi:MAG: cytochrome b [Alphaproteobacteria bacterium]|nr:cytochrome b [Alphaproteobacteria bacterium]
MTTISLGRAPQGAQARYDAVAMTLHWLIAAGILLNIALGLTMSDFGHGSPIGLAFLALHKSVGLTVLAVSALRVLWRLINPFLPPPPGLSAPLRLAARTTHVLFYVLIIATPLAGWLLSSGAPAPLSWFGLFDWPKFWFYDGMAPPDRHHLAENFARVHVTLAWVMIGLIALHVLAALYHQFIRRDRLLARMIPWL